MVGAFFDIIITKKGIYNNLNKINLLLGEIEIFGIIITKYTKLSDLDIIYLHNNENIEIYNFDSMTSVIINNIFSNKYVGQLTIHFIDNKLDNMLFRVFDLINGNLNPTKYVERLYIINNWLQGILVNYDEFNSKFIIDKEHPENSSIKYKNDSMIISSQFLPDTHHNCAEFNSILFI